MENAGEYLAPSGFGEAEFIEKHSRFIGRVWPVETEEDAIALIKETREKNWDASHNVYTYIIKDGGAMRYSDDGEPQGTSGMPVLGVFRSVGVTNVCCIVTRYFGGVLLGAGGLVRAYTHTATLALEKAGISAMRLWDSFTITCSYSLYERVRNEVAASGGKVLNTEYGSDIKIEALVPKEQAKGFGAKINDLTSGTAKLEHKGEIYRPVRVK